MQASASTQPSPLHSVLYALEQLAILECTQRLKPTSERLSLQIQKVQQQRKAVEQKVRTRNDAEASQTCSFRGKQAAAARKKSKEKLSEAEEKALKTEADVASGKDAAQARRDVLALTDPGLMMHHVRRRAERRAERRVGGPAR